MPRIGKRKLFFPMVAVTMGLACLFVVTYLPVDRTEERHAIALSKAGPRGQASFNAAWSDGRLTRIDMYRMREEAGHDVDAWFASPTHAR